MKGARIGNIPHIVNMNFLSVHDTTFIYLWQPCFLRFHWVFLLNVNCVYSHIIFIYFSYVDTVPRFVYLIYEELLQPLPPRLAEMFSPGSGDTTNGLLSNMPPSNASYTSDHSSVYNSIQETSSVRSTR